MPSPLRDPKTLSEWIDLDYFKRRRRFRRLTAYSCWAGLAITVLAVVGSLLPGQQQTFQAAPLSAAHAMFNNDCQQCHTEAFQTLNRFLTHDTTVRSVSDAACSKCHSGPPHHHTSGWHCVECHREHRGESQLTRVADEFCQSCHRELKPARGSVATYRNVVDWRQHPEFARRWLPDGTRDPGTIRFNHQLHLQSEGVLVLDDKQAALQGEAVGKSATLKRKVLRCSDCHEPAGDGGLMKPIHFEQHCSSCHRLSVQVVQAPHPFPAPPGGEGQGVRGDPGKALRTFAAQAVPHDTPEIVRGVLRHRLTAIIRDNPDLLQNSDGTATRPLPGSRPQPNVSREEFAWVNRQQSKLEELIFHKAGWCQYCHQTQAASPHPFPSLPGGEGQGANDLPVFLKSSINSRHFPATDGKNALESRQWFPHSRFSHETHRMVECTSCHNGIKSSTTTAAVHMPTMDTCRKCHQGDAGRGARTDCVECHTYHPSAEKRSVRHLTIEQLMGIESWPRK